MVYDRGEIVRDWLAAKDKNKQVRILADLNQCHPADIAQILCEEGHMSKRSAGQFKRSSSVSASKDSKDENKMTTTATPENTTIPENQTPDDIASAVDEFTEKTIKAFNENLPTITPKPVEQVDHPYHYNNGDIECIDAIKAAVTDLDGFEAFCIGNALKYIWRWKFKNGAEDIEKAVWYLNRLLKEVKD